MAFGKFNNIVYVRTFATLMVVAYHSICMYTHRWDYNVDFINTYEIIAEILNRIDMPAFVFISGFLFSDQISKNRFKSSFEIILHKSKRLLIPYFFWMGIVIIFLPEQLTYDKVINGFSHLWFLPMLFQLFLLAIITIPLWTSLSKKISIICLISMFLFVFLSYYKGWKIPFLYIKTFFPFFYLGIITNRHKLLNINIKRDIKILIVLCAIYLIICTYFHSNNPAIRDLVIKILSCSIIYYIMYYIKDVPSPTNRFITLINDNSMGIYLIHHIIIQSFLSWDIILMIFNNHHIIAPLFIFLFSLLSSILISSRLSKIPYLHNII